MTNAEGFLFIVILLEGVAIFIGAALLFILFIILRKIEYRILRFLIIFLVVLLGFIRIIEAGAPMILTFALAFGVPMAVLIPPFVLSEEKWRTISESVILTCYIAVSIIGALFPYILVASRLSMNPFIYWHTSLSNGIVLLAAMVIYISLALLVYRFLDRKSGDETGEEESG